MDTYLILVEDNSLALIPYKKKSGLVTQAEVILKHSMRELRIKLYHYLCALDQLEFVPVHEKIGVCTDGTCIFYNPQYVVDCERRQAIKNLEYAIAHIVVHGLLGHYDASREFRDKELAWVIMDAQVKVFLDKIGITWEQRFGGPLGFPDDLRVKEVTDGFSCYYKALKSKTERKKWRNRVPRYFIEDHRYWKTQENKKWNRIRGILLGKSVDDMSIGQCMKELIQLGESKDKYLNSGFGNQPGQMRVNIPMSAENNMSYQKLIQQLVKEKEFEKEWPDTLDVMLYSYGLELYGDMPLVEPCEVNEIKQLNSLVIAIDTSGSCSGNVAGRFLRETYNLLNDLRRVAKFESVYLMECDVTIQKEQCLTSIDELCVQDLQEVCGFGGTSFVPVFKRIEELQKNQNVTVDALLYLTDTEGEFPSVAPDYPVILIIPEEYMDFNGNPRNSDIPEWADYVVIE